MFEPIDIYCERLSAGFWAEPLNAVSNGAFMIAAVALWILARRRGVWGEPKVRLLAGLIAVIGVGSFLFHTFANPLTGMADVLPILVFQLCFLGFYARDIAGLARGRVAMLLVGFVAAGPLITSILPPGFANGSLMYAPALLFLAGFAVFHCVTRQRERYVMLAAVAVFAVSLFCRSVDMAVCPHLAIGTHYFWHIFNGIVLYLVTRAYIVNIRRG